MLGHVCYTVGEVESNPLEMPTLLTKWQLDQRQRNQL